MCTETQYKTQHLLRTSQKKKGKQLDRLDLLVYNRASLCLESVVVCNFCTPEMVKKLTSSKGRLAEVMTQGSRTNDGSKKKKLK